MTLFSSPSPQVVISGECVLATVEGLGAFEEIARKVLARNGIENPQRGEWYSYQALLDALKLISDRTGPTTMHRVGMRLAYLAIWPSLQVVSIERTLQTIETALYLNIRGGDVGHFIVKDFQDGSAVVESTLTVPCGIDQGIIEGSLERFCPRNIHPTVAQDSSLPCRDDGNDSCTFLITW